MIRTLTLVIGLGILCEPPCLSPLFAAPMYWDTSSDSGLQPGNGTWDNNTTVMWNSDSDGSGTWQTWTSSANDAHFDASGSSAVTVASGVAANGLVFNGTGYTLSENRVTVGAGGIVANESATMYGATLGVGQSATVAAGKTLTLQSQTTVGSGVAWTKDGAGTLTISHSDPAPSNYGLWVRSGGTYTHQLGTLNAVATYPIRIDGGGTITQKDGVIDAKGYSVLGSGTGPATYNMEGGTLGFQNLYAGWQSKGVINQSGGDVTVSSVFRLADGVLGADSQYNLSGGTLSANGGGEASYRANVVGYRANVEFKQTGGTASFNNLYIGGGGASPVSNGTAAYTLTDGQLTVTDALRVGNDYGFTGNLNVGGGTLTANGDVYLGNVTANDGGATGVATQTGGQVTIDAGHALSFEAKGTHTATYNLNGGTLTLAAINYTDTTTQQFNFGGGTLQANGDLNTNMPMTINAGGATIDTQANTVTLGGILSGAGGLTKLGDGTLTLAGANIYGGGTTISAGTLKGDTGSLQGNIVNNASLVFDQATAGTFSGVLSGSGALTKTGEGSLTLHEGTIGSLTFTQGEIIKDGAGTLDISSGGMALGTGRTYTHKNGTLNNTYFIHAMRVAGGATVAQEGGTINATGYIVLGEGIGTAIYEMTGGELNVTQGGIYAGWSRQGAFNHSGGTVNLSQISLSRDPGSGGSQYNLSGTGTLKVTGTGSVGFRSNAQFNQTGGTASFGILNIGGEGTNPDGNTATYALTSGQLTVTGALRVGNDYGFTGNLDVGGGTLTANGDVYLGNVTANNGGAAGVVNQTGGQVTIAANKALSFRGTGSHAATYNLNGGTLTLAAINYTDIATQQFNFGGGTLQANGNLNTNMPMTINAGGAIIDTQANTVTLGGVLSGAGGLTKLGDGTLTLAGANTYEGATIISTGTLALSHASSNNIAGSLLLQVDAGATLGVTGLTGGTLALAGGQTLGGNGSVDGNVDVLAGAVLSPGMSVGTLNLMDDLSFQEGGFFDIDIADLDSADLVQMDGGLLTPNGATIRVNLDFSPELGDSWTILQGEDELAGAFNPTVDVLSGMAHLDGWKGFAVSYGNSVVLTVIPEPCSALMAALALLALFGWRRR